MEKKFFLIGSLFFFCILVSDSHHLFSQIFSPQEEIACNFLAKGQINQAIEFLEKEIPLSARSLNLRLYLGIAYYLQGDFEKAYKELEKTDDELNDKRVSSRAPHGTSLFLMKTEREMNLSQAILSEQNEGLLYFCRGLMLKDKENFINAEKKFQKARKYQYDKASLSLQLFDLYLATDDLRSASQELALLKQALGDNATVTFLEGCFLYKNGKIDDSLAAFEKVKDSMPEAKRNIALIYYNRSDYQKASDIWMEILTLAPDDKEILIQAGLTYLYLGDREKAQEYFNKAEITIPPEKYSPRTFPLSLGTIAREVKFQLPCR